MSTDSGFMT